MSHPQVAEFISGERGSKHDKYRLPGNEKGFLEKSIWVMSAISCVVKVNSLIMDLHSHFDGLIAATDERRRRNRPRVGCR